jgi:outer membrane biosynthesis protein TonB
MKIQRILASIVLTIFVFGHALSLPAFAETPTAPEAPSAPSAPETPSAPAAPSTPSAPEAPKPDEPKKEEEKKEEKKEEDKAKKEDKKKEESKNNPAASSQPQSTDQPSNTPAAASPSNSNANQPNNSTGNQDAKGNSGETNLTTGNATNGAGVMNSGNNNSSTQAPVNGQSTGAIGTGSSVGIVNSGNGTESNNNGSATINNDNNTNQGNSATIVNDLRQSTTTGGNTAKDNTGGNVNLTTGDANTTGTIINSVNTNMSGVAVAEFNVEEDYRGDIVLDFAAGCISNCGTGSVNLANTGNGSDSNSSSEANIDNTNNINQYNEADIANNLVLKADSGNNEAKDNTNGDVAIKTGDANVAANVLTFANNNVAGNVVYTVVNVFGELVGDIIMPKEYIEAAGGCLECGGGDVNAVNSGNGSESENIAEIDQNTTNNTFQNNDANIENNLIIDATTSQNEVNDNTNGDNSIKTGNTNVDANVINVANSNVSGGVWWLVLVNEAGNWVGKIVGSPDGTNMAGSEGTEFVVDENGEVVARNSDNGSGSTNNTSVAQNNTNNTTQENKINLVNNVDLSANTGHNDAKDNTGGNTSVETGDANVVANIVNFVNNNITGGGKLFVTVVNVFGGGWTGNFITPDATKEQIAEAKINDETVVAQGEPEEELEEEIIEEDSESDETAVTTTRTRRVVKRKAATAISASESQGNSGSGGIMAAAGSSLSQVAGVKIGPSLEIPDGAIVANSKTKINLAWLVFALPLLALIALSRIRIAYYTRRIKNSLESKKVEGVLLGSLVAASVFLLNRVS